MCAEATYWYEVIRSEQRRARKEHTCCACREPIPRGYLYVNSFTVHKQETATYRHCLRCWAILEAVIAARGPGIAIAWELDCGEDWLDTVGALPANVAALAFLTPEEAQAKLSHVTPI